MARYLLLLNLFFHSILAEICPYCKKEVGFVKKHINETPECFDARKHLFDPVDALLAQHEELKQQLYLQQLQQQKNSHLFQFMQHRFGNNKNGTTSNDGAGTSRQFSMNFGGSNSFVPVENEKSTSGSQAHIYQQLQQMENMHDFLKRRQSDRHKELKLNDANTSTINVAHLDPKTQLGQPHSGICPHCGKEVVDVKKHIYETQCFYARKHLFDPVNASLAQHEQLRQQLCLQQLQQQKQFYQYQQQQQFLQQCFAKHSVDGTETGRQFPINFGEPEGPVNLHNFLSHQQSQQQVLRPTNRVFSSIVKAHLDLKPVQTHSGARNGNEREDPQPKQELNSHWNSRLSQKLDTIGGPFRIGNTLTMRDTSNSHLRYHPYDVPNHKCINSKGKEKVLPAPSYNTTPNYIYEGQRPFQTLLEQFQPIRTPVNHYGSPLKISTGEDERIGNEIQTDDHNLNSRTNPNEKALTQTHQNSVQSNDLNSSPQLHQQKLNLLFPHCQHCYRPKQKEDENCPDCQ